MRDIKVSSSFGLLLGSLKIMFKGVLFWRRCMQKTLSFAKNKILLSSLRSRIFTLDFREAILKTFTKTSLATFG